ncbi:TM2 domain protein [Rosistilla carotiformis]|uniref:TM2 domain protein n=1 Tax=Rosistilla carotiformis TaxID=2528017 RepID=A0A518JXI5_9BACT|nr:TM2 domain-containing protein [Rosistilla carotiformis]QDV70254.1 TM2 domain protein [Rosistilla carotiformis]
MNTYQPQTHSTTVGYICWIFGFFGAHRFYFGRPISGTIWAFTLGFFLIGWIVDLFLIPSMSRTANLRYNSGPYDFNVAWVLLTFLGMFGIHRFYMGKWLTGALWFCTGGLFMLGYLYDMWTLNAQVSECNHEAYAGHSAMSMG